jgi:hypothetical protein
MRESSRTWTFDRTSNWTTLVIYLVIYKHWCRSFFLEGRFTFWGGHPWGTTYPKTPLPVPPPNQKGYHSASFFNSASICILIKTWNYNAAELWGKNWDTDAHAHVTYQAPITGLHSPILLPILQNYTDYLVLAQSCKLRVNCCFVGLTNPAACTRARVPLTFKHVYRPPL